MEQQTTNNTKNNIMPANSQNISSYSGKLLKYRARLTKEDRFTLLKAYLGNATDKQLASQLQCTVRTITNYKAEFFKSEEFYVWLNEQLFVLLNSKDPFDVGRANVLSRMIISRDALKGDATGSRTVLIRIIDDVKAVQ